MAGLIFILTEKCNGKCTMCNYWKIGHASAELKAEEVISFGKNFIKTPPDFITLTGGEPLLYPQLFEVAQFFKTFGSSMVLSTNGLLLCANREQVCQDFDKVIVSLNGATPKTHDSIFGRTAFDTIISGITGCLKAKNRPRVILKMTIQKGNFRELPNFLELAITLGVNGVALAVPDVHSSAFHQHTPSTTERDRVLLNAQETLEYKEIIQAIYSKHKQIFEQGYIIEGAPNAFIEYFAYYAGININLPSRDCQIPGKRYIVTAKGDVKYCFFHEAIASIHDTSFQQIKRTVRLSKNLSCGNHPICKSCYQFMNWSF